MDLPAKAPLSQNNVNTSSCKALRPIFADGSPLVCTHTSYAVPTSVRQAYEAFPLLVGPAGFEPATS